ncbi:MAG: GNAT family N-acetyltransferase [Marinosulfonomonas sp.]|nr:GNAT family N-acetyltransferase [Marinosulfonomonas sp.]
MKTRDATAADAGKIAAFWNPMIRDTTVTFHSAQKSGADVAVMIAERQSEGCGFLAAEIDEVVVGFATYAQFRGGDGYARAMEHTIIISPGGQGRGVGRALMHGVEDHARKGGAHSMLAAVSHENAAGIAFHAAAGYRSVALVPQVGRKFDRWLDLVLMQKFL